MVLRTKAPAAGKLTGAQDNPQADRQHHDSSTLPVHGEHHWPMGSSKPAGADTMPESFQLLADRPDLLPVEPDLRELTGQSAQTIRALINSGELPGCRIGRRLYVPKSQFIEYINEGGGLND